MLEIIKRDGQKEQFYMEKVKHSLLLVSKNHELMKDSQAFIEFEMHIQELGKKMSVSTRMIQQAIIDYFLVNQELILKRYLDYDLNHIAYQKTVKELIDLLGFDDLKIVFIKIQKQFNQEHYALEKLYEQVLPRIKSQMDKHARLNVLIQTAVELTSIDAPEWEMIASRLLNYQLNQSINQFWVIQDINSFKDKFNYFVKEDLYGQYLRDAYDDTEINELESYIKWHRDELLTYSSLDLLSKRYLVQNRSHQVLEKPQEMFMSIAMHLAMKEADRLSWSKRIYDVISQLQITLATPTLANARKPLHQLSSCFIDTVPDHLDGIYRSLDNFAKISKLGGGMGLYYGKVRATGSSIRGFEGVAGGVNRWIRLANDTAVAVDQLGVRQGAVAVYLDVWHKDILDFLQLKTNNGDDRLKAHDVFPAISYPNLFWEMVEHAIEGNWYLMCPHQIKQVKGYRLEDSYGKAWEEKYNDCINDPRIDKKVIVIKELVRLILKSVTETGTPFAFYRDHVNEMNPNAHVGMIYASNLCTEIAQNMSAIEPVDVNIDEFGQIHTITKPGDFVVCNLASLVLGHIDVDDNETLAYVIESAVRALDNVIDLNYYPLPYAKITNQRYRAIGLGTSGYHHLLAKKQIGWNSEEHLDYIDKLYERINYYALKASVNIAKEKGAYALFEGSDWQTGAYFEKRQYEDEKWSELKAEMSEFGIRNGYVMAIAPTSSTSIIAGTTASIDPIMKRYFLEEKKGRIVPRVAPELSPSTFWYYQDAHHVDQLYSIKAAGLRQRHLDQAQSLNLYITTDMTMKQILNLFVEAYKMKVKTIYYVRSKSLEVEECDVCSS